MIEIRPFEGDAEELAAFTQRVWRRSYAGQMLTPLWSKEFMERDLLADGQDRDFLIAAYDGARLVGSHPAKPIPIRLHGKKLRPRIVSERRSRLPPARRGLEAASEYVRKHRTRDPRISATSSPFRSIDGPEFGPAAGRCIGKAGDVGPGVGPCGGRTLEPIGPKSARGAIAGAAHAPRCPTRPASALSPWISTTAARY